MSSALLLAAVTATTAATVTTAAPAPRIDLISIGIGDRMYAIYGHAAIRVVQPDGTDTAYNFGGVDIEQPNFWVRLMRGRVETYLEVTPYSELLLKYSAEDRTIVGRELHFSPEVANAIVADLERLKDSPEGRYMYHHVLDNCTTRIAELFDKHLDGQLQAQAQWPVRGTHRDWIIERQRDKPFLYVAMDLTGNGMGDNPLKAWQTNFIPEGFDAIVDRAKFDGQRFVKRQYTQYKSLTFTERPLWDWPWTKVYVLLLGPLLLLIGWRPHVASKILGVIGGLLGLMYIGFWLGSDYVFFHRNWNMLVFPLTHVLLVYPGTRHMRVRGYVLGHTAALLVLALLSWTGVIVQAIGPMLAFMIPASLLLSYRLRTAAAEPQSGSWFREAKPAATGGARSADR